MKAIWFDLKIGDVRTESDYCLKRLTVDIQKWNTAILSISKFTQEDRKRLHELFDVLLDRMLSDLQMLPQSPKTIINKTKSRNMDRKRIGG